MTKNTSVPMVHTIQGDTDVAMTFLHHLYPSGPYVLAAMDPKGGPPEVASFKRNDSSLMRQWIDERNGKVNLYFTVNRTKRKMSRKPGEEDIAYCDYLHADCDPRDAESPADAETRIRARLMSGVVPPPTLVFSSGNGQVALWRLATPVRLTDRSIVDFYKGLNKGIATALGGKADGFDNTHNLDRLLRLPGTVNLPNAKKLSKGRTAELAGNVEHNPSAVYTELDFPMDAAPPIAPSTVPSIGQAEDDVDVDALAIPATIKELITKGDVANKFPSRSEAEWAVICTLIRDNVEPEIILGILLDEDNVIGERVREKPFPERYARKEIEKALSTVAPNRATTDFETAPDVDLDDPSAFEARPRLPYPFIWDMTRLSPMLDYAEAVMLAGGAPLYQTGGRIVHPVRITEAAPLSDDDIRRQVGSLVVGDVSALRLREYMVEHTKFERVTKTGLVPYAPPMMLANHFSARNDKWKLPTLAGIIEVPTLRRDGTLLVDDGYDEASGLFLDTNGVRYPKIEDRPSREAAFEALGLIKTIFREFPFVDGSSLSVMLSAVLTGVSRRSLGSAPLHGTSAPTMATGKTLLQDCVGLIVTGRPVTAMSQGANPEEDEKRIFSSLLKNDQILLIDNVTRPIEGDALCTVLTQPTWQCRILGESRKVSVSTNALFLATGNNLTFKGDMRTRAIVCRIDARVEEPEKRRFSVDLKQYIPKHRAKLVAAAVTVLRAFVVAGRPGLEAFTPFGRFEDWSNLVRGALIWLGEADPCETRDGITENDPERNTVATLMEAIHAMATNWKTPSELIKLADPQFTTEEEETARAALQEALHDAVPRLSAQALGYYLSGREGKIVGDLRLEREHNRSKKVNTYRVVRI